MIGPRFPAWGAVETVRALVGREGRGPRRERPEEQRSLDTWDDWLLFGPRRH
jgi:hypothetical protein